MTIEDEIRDTSAAFIAALLANDGAAVAATVSDGWVYVAAKRHHAPR